MPPTDPIRQLKGHVMCPSCGCIERQGILRCPECGTFHSGAILEERTPPTREERLKIERSEVVDPSAYSLGPSGTVLDEEFEQSDDVRAWDGGSTDFTIDDENDVSLPSNKKIDVPQPELLSDEE